MSRLSPGVCDACDDPVMIGATGWYRCRSCGHESLREPMPALDVAKALFTHWATYDAPDEVSEEQLRQAAAEAIRQGDLFADEWGRAHR